MAMTKSDAQRGADWFNARPETGLRAGVYPNDAPSLPLDDAGALQNYPDERPIWCFWVKDGRGNMIYVTHATVSEYPDPKLAV